MSSPIVDGLPYAIIVSEDASAEIAAVVEAGSSVVLFSDQRVRLRMNAIERAVKRAGARVLGSLDCRGGERCKSVRALQGLWHDLARLGTDRSTTLIAVGGGSITDLAGFAAATYLRGIAWIAIPTTILGMADAAIGGKTAIDLPQGKNLAGAFWPPRAVVADLASIRTLPAKERATGLAEVVKAAIVSDPELLEMVERMRLSEPDLEAWREIIVRAAQAKADVVAADPLERGSRAVLNLGHTIGHAVEHASRGRLSHGAAVAVGLRAAGLLALRLGRFSRPDHARVLRVLRRVGLPLHWSARRSRARTTGLPYEREVLSALRHDKKRKNGAIRFVLPEAIGRVSFGVAVDEALVRDVVRQCAGPPQVEETME